MRLASIAAVVLLAAGVAYGQTPVVENLYVPEPGTVQLEGPNPSYVDIPGTEKTVTIPSGMVYISWQVVPSHGLESRIRPMVGTQSPTQGLYCNAKGGTPSSGSWTTTTEGGTVEVKLQVAVLGPWTFTLEDVDSSLSWTLIVFPEVPPPAPAVSVWGLAVIALAMVAAGSLVIRRSGRLGSV